MHHRENVKAPNPILRQYPVDEKQTRLLTRLRTKYVWKGLWIIFYLLYDFGDIVMMSKCMKGIKLRAENEFKTQSATNK